MTYFKNPIKKSVLNIRGTNSTFVFIIIICIHKNFENFNEKDIFEHRVKAKKDNPMHPKKN